MVDLSTTYLGLDLHNPVVPSASPLSREIGNIRAMEDAGASAVVLYSLFEEQFDQDGNELEPLSQGAGSLAQALRRFPDEYDYVRDPDGYVEHVHKAKAAVDIPIIASMNGTSRGGWLRYAQQIEQAGADALELNIYFVPATGRLSALGLEMLYLDVVRSVKELVSIPVAVKLSPFFTALPSFVGQLAEAGADGVVLFNRFYQPNLDVERQGYVADLTLSTPADLLLPLRWAAILYGQFDVSLALTSGVHSPDDVLKAVMAGADVANVCSVLLKNGIGELNALVEGVAKRMEVLEIASIAEVRGRLSLQKFAEPAALERAGYIKLLHSFGRIG